MQAFLTHWRLESYKSKAAGRLRGGRNQPKVHCVAAALLSLSLKNYYCLVPQPLSIVVVTTTVALLHAVAIATPLQHLVATASIDWTSKVVVPNGYEASSGNATTL
ncbi:hypothetical protein GW17_00060719 [Ensete ventricosum]|nr:hypothetical protein GW17_00060719 [Ensete ventricosum]